MNERQRYCAFYQGWIKHRKPCYRCIEKTEDCGDCGCTLLKSNIAPEIGHPKRKLVFQPSIFRCYVSFREGKFVEFFQTSSCLTGQCSMVHDHPVMSEPLWWFGEKHILCVLLKRRTFYLIACFQRTEALHVFNQPNPHVGLNNFQVSHIAHSPHKGWDHSWDHHD